MNLDQRQRAMLQEMGVQVWQPWPVAKAAADLNAIPQAAKSALATPQTPEQPPVAALSAKELRGLDWEALGHAVAQCRACGLCQNRTQTVFGVGDTRARWLVVGEAPGENEDLQGQPFVGQAGLLLDNMLRALGLSRQASGEQAVYIANVLKCRPPANRNPSPQEVQQCQPFLHRQVELLQPKIILALGRFAAQSLLQTSMPEVANMALGKLRGQVHFYGGIPVVVSYHPAYLLRSPQDKAKAWVDLCLARSLMQGN
ncbi:MAG: hypothetical protein RL468_312 [Pseudomonadota bacterium]